jgi:hypothetical protein
MSPEAIIALVGSALATVGIIFFIVRRLPKRLKAAHYTRKWRDIQRLCADKSNWPQAILLSDLLLDEILRKKRKEGKTMGERMVSAQKTFTANEAIWKAHKLANHVRTHNALNLKENDVKESLIAYRQALRDLGAL